jgi:hypothetical protein
MKLSNDREMWKALTIRPWPGSAGTFFVFGVDNLSPGKYGTLYQEQQAIESCQYCRTKLNRGVTQCPYCGAPITLNAFR